MERTLIILKPDALKRRLAGRILSRFEEKGLSICGMRMAKLDRETAEKHYAPHQGKPFFAGLVRYMTSEPVVLIVLSGIDAVAVCRKLLGKTFGYEAEAGTIRGDFGMSRSMNLVHASDSPESARRELDIFFSEDDLFAGEMPDLSWVYDPVEELGDEAPSR